MSLKLVIADDEPMARERLRMLLADESGVEVVAEAGDGQQVLDACAAHRPHAVLLDIAMPGIDGLETARRLAAATPPTAVVFCTAYDAHALSAFEAAALDYLVKPVRPERLAAALERVRTFLAGRPATASGKRTHLCARLRGSLRLIPLEDEVADRFVRIHRNCLVARQELVELRRGTDGHVMAMLRSGGTPLEVSRRCVPQLRQTLRHL